MRPITRLATRRILWFVLPAAVLVFAAAFFPSISQRVPRFAFPASATVGAALLVFSCVNSLVQFVRRYRREGRLRVFPVIVNAIATIFLVVLPLTRLLGVLTASGGGAPRTLAGFGDWLGGEGYPRLSPIAASTWQVASGRTCRPGPTVARAGGGDPRTGAW